MKSRQLLRQLLAQKIGPVNGQGKFFSSKNFSSQPLGQLFGQINAQLNCQVSYMIKKNIKLFLSQLCDQNFFKSIVKLIIWFKKNVSIIVIFWLILVGDGKNWPTMVQYGQ